MLHRVQVDLMVLSADHSLLRLLRVNPAQRSLSPRRAFICARVTLPTFTELGVPEPFSMPAAFCSSTDAGGVFRMKVKLRSCGALVACWLLANAEATDEPWLLSAGAPHRR